MNGYEFVARLALYGTVLICYIVYKVAQTKQQE